jgi:hypothetical protein
MPSSGHSLHRWESRTRDGCAGSTRHAMTWAGSAETPAASVIVPVSPDAGPWTRRTGARGPCLAALGVARWVTAMVGVSYR